MDSNLKREIILDNYENPMHRGLVNDDSYLSTNYNSESCIDNLTLMMKVEDNIIKDIVFDGEACAISTSATSIFIRNLIGKSVEDAKKLILNYKNMLEEKEYDEDLLQDLVVYENISKQPNRMNCALLPSSCITKMLEQLEK